MARSSHDPDNIGPTEAQGIEAAEDDCRPTTSVEEIAIAVARGQVTFWMLMKTLYGQWAADSDEYLRERYRVLYKPALSCFIAAHGGIEKSFYANEFPAGVVLTCNEELFADVWWDAFKFDTTPARQVEADINDLCLKAWLYLPRKHRLVCLERLMRLYKGLISSLRLEYCRWHGKEAGDERTPAPGHFSDLRELQRELKHVRANYLRIGEARGQARYTLGAAVGSVAIVVAAGLAAIQVDATQHTVWLGALAGGALGALLSVLERLTRRRLRVRFESDWLMMSGASRPVIGALSGVALFALVEGGTVPLDVPDTETSRGLFFAGTAFLAGFSERLAKDVFGSAAASLSGGDGSEGQFRTGPTSGAPAQTTTDETSIDKAAVDSD